MRRNTLTLFSLFLLLLVLSCGDSLTDSGSGTGTGNPIIAGIAKDSLGNPLAFAKLTVRPSDYFPDSTDLTYLDSSFDAEGYIYTDSLGRYSFTLEDTGSYQIEIYSQDSSLAITSDIEITENDSLITDTITLIPLDTFKAVLRLWGSTQEPVDVFINGRDKYYTVNAGDSCRIPLPKGKHNILFVPQDTANYYTKPVYLIDSDFRYPLEFLAKEPVSNSYQCDSVIVRTLLDWNYLGSLDISIFSFTDSITGRITQVDIERDTFETLYSIIGGLTELTDLEIQYTQITSVPERIGELRKLKELELNNNKLESLPASIVNLTNLIELRLENNHLINLPPEIESWCTTNDPNWKDSQTAP